MGTKLISDPATMLLEPYGAGDSGTEVVRTIHMVYVSLLVLPIILGGEFISIHPWISFRSAIATSGIRSPSKGLADWPCMTLLQSGPRKLSPLIITTTIVPLVN